MSDVTLAAGAMRLSTAGGVAELRLCSGDSRNALSSAMWTELRRFAKGVTHDRSVRVILLAGDDTVFSSGADIREFASLRAPGATRAYDDLVESALRALEAVPQPTLACIAGPCVGAGASLACGCDLRIAADDAYFMVPAARLGLGYDPRGIARFVRVFGDSAARGLLLGAQRCEARAAHAQGIVHRLVKPGTVIEEGRRLARAMAGNAPLTVAAAKAALDALARGEDGGSEALRRLALDADAGADYAEGLSAFEEKRKPEFRGREQTMKSGNLVHALYGHRTSLAPAFVVPDGPSLSTGEVLTAIDKAAAALAACGVKAGDRVSVRVGKCVEAVFLAHACFKTGAILHPMNTGYTPREVEALLADARPALFVCDPDEMEAFRATAARYGFRVEGLRGSRGSFADLVRASGAGAETMDLPDDAPAALLYTSGTTGRPKGALITHGNLAASAKALVEVWRLGGEDILLHALPAYHAHGLLTAINVLLTAGGAICFVPRFEAEAVLRELPRCTVMMAVPTHYARLLKEPGLREAVSGAFRLAISGSAPLPPDVAQRFRQVTGMEIIERYGSTEAAIITAIPPGTAGRRGWVGWPLPGVRARVANENGRFESAATGVLETRGHNVFAGYWNRPEERAFTGDGWFVTGDVAEIDDEGCIRILGRETDVVISGGLNVYPKEVEDALDRAPGVAGAAVFGVPHPDFGEAVVAVVESPAPASFDENACIGYLKTELAPYKVPKRVIAVDAIPRNELGKVAKAALREAYGGLFAAEKDRPGTGKTD